VSPCIIPNCNPCGNYKAPKRLYVFVAKMANQTIAKSRAYWHKNTVNISRQTAVTLISAFCCLTTGCGSLKKFQVAIDSDPQGARIEVNNDYVGKTPTTYSIAGNADRSFNGNWVQGSMIEFIATPPAGETNLFVQKKVFRPSAFFQQGDHIPERMFFDMRLKSEQFNINISER
jgi:hypothetical protein